MTPLLNRKGEGGLIFFGFKKGGRQKCVKRRRAGYFKRGADFFGFLGRRGSHCLKKKKKRRGVQRSKKEGEGKESFSCLRGVIREPSWFSIFVFFLLFTVYANLFSLLREVMNNMSFHK